MKSLSFANFQVGIVDNPSIEDKGGFEFASGMDIFSEPGVLKACNAMETVTFGASASPSDVPLWMVDTADGSSIRAYVVAGDKLLESTDGSTFNLFLTQSQGNILGLEIYNGYVWYPAATKLGRVPIGNVASKNDTFATIDSDPEYHPMVRQGGTLKGGAGRYVFSVDEASVVTAQAMKLPLGYRIRTLVDHFSKLFGGTRFGAMSGSVTTGDATVFDWKGTVLSTGTALPDTLYPIKMRGMNAIHSDGGDLFGFPDQLKNVDIFDGARFGLYRKLFSSGFSAGSVNPGAVSQHLDTILYAGAFAISAGVMQMKGKSICQAFVPSVLTPGAGASINIGFVKSSFNGTVFIGYYETGGGTYHIEKSGSNKQNNAFVRTLWHRAGSDKLKRWMGVKLNLKPMAANTAVTVSYRTDRNASFVDAGYTITSANQNKPVILAAQPRAREIQFKLTYTTATSNTPELLSYDPLFDDISSVR